MTVWRYTALQRGPDRSVQRSGELSASCAADVRAELRRIGLQVIELRPIKQRSSDTRRSGGIFGGFVQAQHKYQRKRRRNERAELYDGLSTMLDSGLPLLEACETVAGSVRRRRSALRSMLVDLGERLRCGSALASAMSEHPGWFDRSEIAMVEAGQHSGTLPDVLRTLSRHHERAGELGQKLAGALAYPMVVAVVGLGVVVFLSVKTLPDLAGVLADAGVETPPLTARVMWFGQFLAGNCVILAGGALALALAIIAGAGICVSRGIAPPAWLRELSPRLPRRLAVARLSVQLAALLRTGVPMVDALRVVAPTTTGITLRQRLEDAANRVERGEDVAAALDDDYWFDAEFQRLLQIGQTSGELDTLLDRLGRRYARQANRMIDRLATLLEPCVILTLAVLVGIVVMAAILPLLRLQEVV